MHKLVHYYAMDGSPHNFAMEVAISALALKMATEMFASK